MIPWWTAPIIFAVGWACGDFFLWRSITRHPLKELNRLTKTIDRL